MRIDLGRIVLGLIAALLFSTNLIAQEPPRDRGQQSRRTDGRDGRQGREAAGSIERIIDGLNLSGTQRETIREAVRSYQGTVRGLSDQAETKLMESLKEVLSAQQYQGLVDETRNSVRSMSGRPAATNGDVVARLQSFDKNQDVKVSKDEFPERTQALISRGDTNKDGALSKDEILALETTPARANLRARGEGGRGDLGRDGRGGPWTVTGFSLGQIEQAVGRLKLTENQGAEVTNALKSAREDAQKQTQKVRSERIAKAGDTLGKENLEKFKAALERSPAIGEQPRRAAERGRANPEPR